MPLFSQTLDLFGRDKLGGQRENLNKCAFKLGSTL